MKLLFYIFGSLFIILPIAGNDANFARVDTFPPYRAKLLFAGDLMQHMPQVAAARSGNGFDYSKSFEYVRDYFRSADVSVVNFETTLSPDSNYSGYPCFRSPVALADALQDLGVDIAVLANNHCCDGGGVGVRTTIDNLTSRGIKHTGVFTDSVDYNRNNPLCFKANGISFAMLNYTYSTNGIAIPEGVVVNGIDTLLVAADLAKIDRLNVDCVVAFMHWGNEYERTPSVEQQCLSAFLRRNGVDVIIGSHPHVVQPIESDSTRITVYSLGNFVSNQQKRYTDGGIMVELEVIKYSDNDVVYGLNVVPVWVLRPDYRIIPSDIGDTLSMDDTSRVRYRQFMDDTCTLLDL